MVDASGRRYTTNPLHAPGETRNGDTGRMWKGMLPPKGRHWRYDPKVLDELDAKGLIAWSAIGNPRKIVYADEMPFTKLQDIWEFNFPSSHASTTEKNLEMLRTIVETSSTPDSIVLDCFAGSGTTLVAADQLNRSWIGIDRSEIAIKTALGRLKGRVDPAQTRLFAPTDDILLAA